MGAPNVLCSCPDLPAQKLTVGQSLSEIARMVGGMWVSEDGRMWSQRYSQTVSSVFRCG